MMVRRTFNEYNIFEHRQFVIHVINMSNNKHIASFVDKRLKEYLNDIGKYFEEVL